MTVRSIFGKITYVALTIFVLEVAPAFAKDGVGWIGPGDGLDDKIVTNIMFGVIGFFIVGAAVASGIQALLERRKQAKKQGISLPRK